MSTTSKQAMNGLVRLDYFRDVTASRTKDELVSKISIEGPSK